MNLKIDIDLNKYKPQKSDLNIFKDPSIIFAVVFVIGLLFMGPLIMLVEIIVDWLTDDAYAPTSRHRISFGIKFNHRSHLLGASRGR